MNHGFTEVSHFMCGSLSLVMVGNRKGSVCQALGFGKGKQWRGEALLLPNSTFTKKYFLVPGENHVGKNVCSRLQDWFYWCVVLHLSLFSLFSLLCQLALTLLHSHPSQLSCLPALLAPGHLHSHSQAPLLHQLPLNLSGSTGVPPALCVCAVHILLISAL